MHRRGIQLRYAWDALFIFSPFLDNPEVFRVVYELVYRKNLGFAMGARIFYIKSIGLSFLLSDIHKALVNLRKSDWQFTPPKGIGS